MARTCAPSRSARTRPNLTASIGGLFKRATHGVLQKTYSVTHLNVNEASRRYSPAQVVAVAREVISGVPSEISTSYVERQNLTLRMASKRFARLSNGFSKKIDCHLAAVGLVPFGKPNAVRSGNGLDLNVSNRVEPVSKSSGGAGLAETNSR